MLLGETIFFKFPPRKSQDSIGQFSTVGKCKSIPMKADRQTYSGSSWKSWDSAKSSYSAAASLPAKISSLEGTITWKETKTKKVS